MANSVISILRGSATTSLTPRLQHRLADFRAENRVLFGGIRADDQHGLRMVGDVIHRVGHRTRAKGSGQTGHGAGVSETGAMIDIVRPNHLPGEFIHQVVFFIQTFGRGEHPDAICAVLVAGL